MARLAAALTALALGTAAAGALSACGSGSDAKLLPGRTANEISENLTSVKRLVDEGECVGAQDAALQVSNQVQAVHGIDPKLKGALEEGATRLNEVVDSCEEEREETVEETEPTTVEAPSDRQKQEEKALEQEEKEAEKAEKQAEKEAEKAEEEQEAPPPAPPGPPKGLPPQAHGEAKGHDEGPAEPGPSGGIGPGSEVGGD